MQLTLTRVFLHAEKKTLGLSFDLHPTREIVAHIETLNENKKELDCWKYSFSPAVYHALFVNTILIKKKYLVNLNKI